ncbi:MAG TPA: HIT domain-containing protein [Vicinamibacteria bacterium]|nr:HIT domain-containing protein [Vicinamibacteria bacterium]
MVHAIPEGGPVPGWLVVAPARHVEQIDALRAEELSLLGPLLAQVAAALRAETSCEKVYVSLFAEVLPHLHVHVVARPPGWAPAETGPRLFLAGGRAEGAEALTRRVLARLAAPAAAKLPARSRPLRAALLSGLVCPGAGQIHNREYGKGVLLIGATLISAIWLIVRLVREVLGGLPEDMATFDPLSVLAMVEEVQRRNGGFFVGFTLLLTALWVYGIVDAYRSGPRPQR